MEKNVIDRHPTTWQLITETVIGASHAREGRPNQDAVWPSSEAPGEGEVLIVSVADGHGSAPSFRSAQGAQLATEITRQRLATVWEVHRNVPDLGVLQQSLKEQVPRELVEDWERAVDQHQEGNPITEAEWEEMERRGGAGSREMVENNPRLIYGATLLGVLVTDRFILYLQLGDGDILTVDSQGTVATPLPCDPLLFANETTSLCSRKAWRHMRTLLLPLSEATPVMILLTTDGYSNSYSNNAGFHQVAEDIWRMISAHGLAAVRENLPQWMKDTSYGGSGDDITLGLLWRTTPAESV